MDFVLRQQLVGHTGDVKCVLPLTNGTIATASRDFSIKLWQLQDDQTYKETHTLIGHSNFVNCLSEITASSTFPNGALVSGGTDSMVLVWDKADYSAPHFALQGHSNTISSVHCSADGSILLSGSYDGTCIVWDMKTGSKKVTIEAHHPAVLCVYILANGLLVSGGADNVIKIWEPSSGTLLRELKEHSHGVRKLIEIPDLGLLSCANDGNVLLWDLMGECLQKYVSHQAYCYSIAVIQGIDEFTSCGEDALLNVWKAGQCIQSIQHPGSVWSVETLVRGNGEVDIVTGCSDGVARIWTRDPNKAAPPEQVVEYHQALIDAQAAQAAAVDSQSANQTPQDIDGVRYDFIWNVDLGDNGPKRYLGHNFGDDPSDSARRFLIQNGLPLEDIYTVVEFINNNTQNMGISNNARTTVTQSQSSSSSSSNHSNSDNMEVDRQTPPSSGAPVGLFPVLHPLNFSTLASLPQLQKKIEEQFPEKDVKTLGDIIKTVKQQNFYHSSKILPHHVSFIVDLVTVEDSLRFPCLDLLRSVLIHPLGGSAFVANNINLISLIIEAGLNLQTNPKNFIMAAQSFANVFAVPQNIYADNLLLVRETVLNTIADALNNSNLMSLKPTLNALATILLNYSVLFYTTRNNAHHFEAKVQCASILFEILQIPVLAANRTDEVVFRSLVAIGTLVAGDEAIQEFINSQDLSNVINSFAQSSDSRVVKCVPLLLSALK